MSTISKPITAVWVGLVAGAVLLVVMGLVSGQRPARAQSVDTLVGPTLQFGCGVAKVAAMDPIFDPEHPHEHVFYGNRGVDVDSTYESLVNNPDTTCAHAYATSSYWHPVVRDGTEPNPPSKLSVYYVGAGDQTQIQHIPDGLQLLGTEENGEVDYRCGQDPPVTSPPYGCTAEEFRIRVIFPECWDRSSLAPDSLVDKRRDGCPSSHPVQIPSVRLSVHYENVGGVLEGPLMVSAGNGGFWGADFFHADIFEAPQQPDFNNYIQRCVMDVADDEVRPSVCQPALRPETTLDPSGPSGSVGSGSGTFTFSTTEIDSTFECRVYQVGTTPGRFGACSGNGTHEVSGLESGTYTFEVRAVDAVGKVDLTPASRTWTVDTTAPTITSFMPTGTGISPEVKPTVTFSEKMDKSTLEASTNGLPTTFFLEQDTTKVVATVSYVETETGEYEAVLSPTEPLRSGISYTATVTSAAQDVVGNALAAEHSWTFTVE